MRQITLLGDAAAASHPLRPDRVYRTGVLAPMVGFQPGMAVQATANAFALGPQTGMSLHGVSGWRARLSMWWQGIKLRAKAGKGFMLLPAATATTPNAANVPQIHTDGGATPPVGGFGHPGYPAYVTAQSIGPQTRMVPQQLVAAAYGQSSSLPTSAAEAAAKTTMMMWRGARWPWH